MFGQLPEVAQLGVSFVVCAKPRLAEESSDPALSVVSDTLADMGPTGGAAGDLFAANHDVVLLISPE